MSGAGDDVTREVRYRYELAKPLDESLGTDWKFVRNHFDYVDAYGKPQKGHFALYTYLPHGEVIRKRIFVDLVQVEQERFVTEWEDVSRDDTMRDEQQAESVHLGPASTSTSEQVIGEM